MTITPEAIKHLTDKWIARQHRLVEKAINRGEDPMVAYSAALGCAVNTLVNFVIKFDQSSHKDMFKDLGKMVDGLYMQRMSVNGEQPRIILPHQMN